MFFNRIDSHLFSPRKVFSWLGSGLFIIIILGPCILLLTSMTKDLFHVGAKWLSLTIPSGRRLDIFLRSLGLALAVAIGAMVIGVFIASFLWRKRGRLWGSIRWFILLLIAIPPYVHALAWMSTISFLEGGLLSFGLSVLPFKGVLASWWIQLMALLPLSIGMSLLGLQTVNPEFIEASRMMQPDFDAFKKVVFPLAIPLILAGGGIVFLFSLTDYSVPSLFQVNVYALEIFAEFSASNEPGKALLLAVPLLVVTFLVMTFSQSRLRNAALKPVKLSQNRNMNWQWPSWFLAGQRLGIMILVFQALVPLVALMVKTGSLETFYKTGISAYREIGFTFWNSILVSLICLPLAFPVARNLGRKDRSGKIWWILVTLPLAVPAPLIGIGLILLFNRPILGFLYNTPAMIVFASLARFLPLAALILLAQFRRIDPLLIDAARILQKNPLKTWIYIRLPMIFPGVLAAACIMFIFSAGELGATLIVIPAGISTLTIRIYNYLHYGASEAVAGLCLMMAASALFAVAVAALILQSREKIVSLWKTRRL